MSLLRALFPTAGDRPSPRSVVLTLLAGLVALATVAVLPAAPASAATGTVGAAFACTPHTVYSLEGPGNHDVKRVNPDTGAEAANGDLFGIATNQDVNAFALPSSGGRYGYLFNRSTNQVVRFDVVAGSYLTYNAPANATAGDVVAGAINPVNGWYYYATGSATTWKVYAFNPATGTAVGQVAQITGVSNNGDMAFDSSGNLYLVTNSGNDAAGDLRRVNGTLGTTAGTTSFGTTLLSTLPAGEGVYVGAAFDRTAAGATVLVVGTSEGALLTVDPSTGAQLKRTVVPTPFNDLASCNAPAPIRVPDFSCAPDTVYAVVNDRPHAISKVTPSTGAATGNGAVLPNDADAVNAFAIPAEGGRYAYFFNRTDNAVLRFDAQTSDTTAFAAPANTDAGSVVAGAINPVNGFYYYAASVAGTWKVFAFNTNTSTAIGQVATISGLQSNGDFAFDGNGILYVATNADAAAGGYLARLGSTLPTTAGTTALTTTRLADLPADSGQYASVAFEDSGILVVGTSTGKLLSINPSSGALISTKSTTVTFSDMASCAVPSTAKAQVNLPAGRAVAADQFTVTITGGGLAAANSGTTAGTDTGLQGTAAETAGPVLLLAGTEYTATQTATGGANLAAYTTTYKCLSDATGATLSQGSGSVAKFTAPSSSNVTCVFTSTPAAPAVLVDQTVSAISDLDGNGPDAGDRVTYGYTVKNTGDTALSAVTVTDARLGAVTCPKATLAVGETMTCTSAPYTLTQADVDAGEVDSSATAKGTSPAGVQVTSTDPTTVSIATNPLVDIDLTASAVADVDGNGQDAGDTITYSYKVTNTGNVNLTTVAVTDTRNGATTCAKTALAPGESTTCTSRTSVLTQADVNAGAVDDTATVTAKAPSGATVTDTDSETTTVAQNPAIDIDLTASAVADVDGNGPDAGDRITYTYKLTNTGNVPLTAVGASDTRTGALVCARTALAPGESTTCTAKEYVLTQADVNAGTVSDTATTTGKHGTVTVTDTDVEATTVPQNPSILLDQTAGAVKDVDGNGPDAGDTITYTHKVTNTGNVTLSGLQVTDTKTGAVTCTTTTLAPGESFTCTPKDLVLTQADVNAGKVDNAATATAQDPKRVTVSSPDTVSTPVAQVPAVIVDQGVGPVQDVDGNGPDAGDTLSYTHRVTNTGNVTLTGVTVTDTRLGAVTCPKATLAPGESMTCTPVAYTLTQADLNAGRVVTSATTTGTAPDGTTKVSSTDGETVTITGSPAVTIDQATDAKVTDLDGNGTDAGDTVVYQHTIANTGNVTLTDVKVTDPKLGTVACGTAPVTLAPGQVVTCTPVTYTLTQADVDASAVSTTAKVVGTSPSGVVVSDSDTTSAPIAGTAARIDIDLTASAIQDVDGNGPDAGDRITYSYEVTNTGGVTLQNVVATDTKAGTLTCQRTTLAVGESMTCTSTTHTLTQAEVDAGKVTTSATAYRANAAQTPTSTDTVTTTVPPAGTIRVDLTAGPVVDVDGNGPDAGDTVTHTYKLTNTGNVTLTNASLSDTFGPVTCPTGAIAPGQTVTCTARTVTLKQSDIDAGRLDDVATVTATTPAGATATDSDAVSTVVPRVPAVEIDLTAGAVKDVDANGIDAGDTVTYTYKVTNTGNVVLDPVTVEDTRFGAITCPSGPLAPGASVTCTPRTHVLTQADVNAGKVDDTATVTGTAPGGAKATDVDATSTPVPVSPALDLVLVAGPVVDTDDNGTDPGDTVTWTHTVTNTGNVPLTGVTVTDRTGAVACTPATLEPGQKATCTSTYPITQADINAGAVQNSATATGTAPNGAKPSDTETATTTVVASPGIRLVVTAAAVKDVDGNGTDAGDTVTYGYQVTNTGNVPLSGVTVTSDDLGAVTCPATTLAPGASMDCTPRTRTLTQADINAGSVVETGTATGRSPGGDTVSDPDSAYTALVANPAVEIDLAAGPVKDLDGNGPDAGDTIAYTYTVKNVGNVALNPVTVLDDRSGAVTCPTGALAPGASVTCTGTTYTLKQADLDAGTVTATATATGKGPGGQTVTDTDTVSTTVAGTPKVSLDKTGSAVNDLNGNGPDAGDTITYTFAITNTGTVTVSQLTVSDPKTGPVTCPSSPLAPGATVSCTPRTYTLSQDDVDAGEVVNTATLTVTGPDGVATGTATDTDTVTFTPSRAIGIEAVAGPVVDLDGNGPDAGDTISWTYTVTNGGAVPLTGVSVTDPKAGAVTCPATTLAVGASMVCSTSQPYVITAADVTAGSVDTTATVVGKAPQGQTVTDKDTTTTPVRPQLANVKVDLTADRTTVAPGSTVTYTLVVTNDGRSVADDVVLKDVLPAGVTYVSSGAPCAATGASVSCDFGSLPAGGSRTVTIVARVDPLTPDDADHQHLLDVQKTEAQLDLEPGQTRTVTVSCAPGYVVTDGSGRVDAVDQGTGTLASVGVLSSVAVGADSWAVTATNQATGRAQAKVFAVCVRTETETVDGHSHQVQIGAPVTRTVALPAGRTETTLTCAPGTVPTTPSWSLDGLAQVVTSQPSGSDGWTFVVDNGQASSATFTIGCLDTKVSLVDGHQHDLVLTDVTQTVTVPAGQTLEVTVSCAGDAKGVRAGYDLDPGLVNLGNDPRPVVRVFKLLNPTSGPLEADLSLQCLSVRTKAGVGTTTGGRITNTATVSTSSAETSTADNSDSVTVTVGTTSAPVVAPASSTVVVAARATSVSTVVSCGTGTGTCRGTATLLALTTQRVSGQVVRKGTVLAKATYAVAAGKKATVAMRPTAIGKKALKATSVKRAQVKVGGKVRTVTIRR